LDSKNKKRINAERVLGFAPRWKCKKLTYTHSTIKSKIKHVCKNLKIEKVFVGPKFCIPEI
jgi:hypothetical protein